MLLVMDVGNTDTVLGVYDGEELCTTGGSAPRLIIRLMSTVS